MQTIDVHWVHCKNDWVVPGYQVRENPERPDGDIGILIDYALQDCDLQQAYKPLIAILHEPRPKIRHIYELVEALHEDFLAIITYDAQLLELPNARMLGTGGSRVQLDRRFAGPVIKTELLSLIASWKVQPDCRAQHIANLWDVDALDGYRMRWIAAGEFQKRGLPLYGSVGRGATEIGPGTADKARILAPTMFSVEAECHRAHNWFTEKLIDCLVLRTVPIYRGAGNIGDFFNVQGMLLWDTPKELRAILDKVESGEIQYADFWPHLLINQQKAMAYADLTQAYCRVVRSTLRDRVIHIDIHDPYPNISGLFWEREGYELHMNPPDCRGDIGVFWDDRVLIRPRRRSYSTKFAVLHEPRCKQPSNYQVVQATLGGWTGVFAHDPDLLKYKNVHLGLATCTWAGPQGLQSLHPSEHHDKPVLITMVSSNKARPDSTLDGYRMRYAAAQELIRRGIIVYGTGGTVPTPPGHVARGKLDVLIPAQFSVEAECHKRDNWFTEKLLDCFMMMTVPVYYGPDNIHSYFAPDSMLAWNCIEELREILDAIESGEIQYEDFFPAMLHARASADLLTYPPQRHLDKIVEIWEAQCESK